MNNIEAILEKEGYFACTTVGLSMYPMLRNRKDTVVIYSVNRCLKKYDVLLYRRGNDYVLHRVIKVLENGYLIRGDNCFYNELVLDNQVIGILGLFYRNKKKIKISDWRYVCYYQCWCFIHPIGVIFIRIRTKIGCMIRYVSNKI